MTTKSNIKTIDDFLETAKKDYPAIHAELSKDRIKPIFQETAHLIIQLYEDGLLSTSDKLEEGTRAVRLFGNTCRNDPTAIKGLRAFNNFLNGLSKADDVNPDLAKLYQVLDDQIESYEEDDELESEEPRKIQAYICVYIGEMRRGLGADIRIIDSIEEYFKWFIAPYDLNPKDIKVDGSRLTADLQVDEENGLDVEIDFNDRDSLVKLEEDIDITLFPDGSPWRTQFHPVYEGEPLTSGEIFSDSIR
ncbi:hypothetical protein [Variovorax sp. RA8]|uniref:hypothetical protein n=1 Tax=Variovorax sp. (strain JCM 16519 / RA8) TaxID=662548 RepID=UPI000AB64A8F|nr:hypothetical protein [Variovorax sp. RA8]VTU34786.1 hypothetical protein RA8CHR_05049 [Variovorax sp. RA8]